MPDYHPRTAVILRSWIDKQYSQDEIYFIRSMIMELSLFSGAEYEVILLIDAKTHKLPKPADQVGMRKFKARYLPPELRDLAVFFNEQILKDWYPKIDIHEYGHSLCTCAGYGTNDLLGRFFSIISQSRFSPG